MQNFTQRGKKTTLKTFFHWRLKLLYIKIIVLCMKSPDPTALSTRRSRQTSYNWVRQNVLEMIRQDQFQPGDRLPSERELATRLGLNHLTIRRGLAALVQEQVIERRVGAGTFLRGIPEGTVTNGPPAPGPATDAPVQIGVLALPQSGTFVNELLGQFHQEAERRGLQLVIHTVSSLGQPAQDTLRQMAAHGCLAVLIPGLPDDFSLADLAKLVQNSPLPVVLAKPYPGLEANSYDQPATFGRGDYLAIEMACQYLRSLTYGHIAFFGPDALYLDTLNRRILAYTRFMSRQGLETLVGLATPEARDVDRIVKAWSRLTGDLAVICYDDDFAIRLMTALHKAGLRIPEDVAVLGFNNIPLGISSDPPLSTIQFDYGYVAQGMLDHALAMATGKPPQPPPRESETLVIRNSCGGPLRAGDRLAQVIADAQTAWNRDMPA
jgi:DNA-binding LacI/PurR family transcriptional regulator